MSITKIIDLIGLVFLGLYGFYIADIFTNLFFKYSIIIGMLLFTISIILEVIFYIKNYIKNKKEWPFMITLTKILLKSK